MRLRIVIVAIAVVGLAACGGSSKTGSLQVVAAENVYGDIVRQIGGAHVDVASILTDPNADPHLFEPGTRNGLAVARAKVIVQNGAGYDTFMAKLEHAAPSSDLRPVTVADVLGVHGSDANPHFWYDAPRLPRIASAITAALTAADPRGAAAYRAGLKRFVASLHPLQHEVAALRREFAGAPVAYTEPVPGYLLEAAGLHNLAPQSFARAIENGTEPSPQSVAAMDALFATRHVRVLLYNSQAVSPITSRVRAAAESAGVPVVGVTETLPPARTFQQWQLAQARALRRALAR